MLEDFIEELLYSKEWRSKELSLLRKIYVIDFYNSNSKIKEQYLRMCIPYIYSHWEGFVVETFKSLIRFINNLNLNTKEVHLKLLTFSLIHKLRPLAGKQSFNDCCNFIENFTKIMDTKFNIFEKNFSTKSNLNYNQLLEIFNWFNLDNSKISEYKVSEYKESINRLVNIRNKIAHGENGIKIEFKHIEEYISTINTVFDIIILLIKDYIYKEKYLKG